ncbi:hypothetical protein A7A08_01675 [Methyloligella halotolerans]|uniref:HTH cro/C1-type domain-containing protein n=1 Tax=Methyloligella halotolerans TaxID=1177755 RepID=A0A1E2RZQ6_9HYPH|nr:helix-turn-helix domain-containing protein [Methyloligella halotolerans]ODA67640.1 hypothetical protein A7A08_01675 [Methyloligella halotolerans]
MRLAQYLKSTGERPADFAKRIGRSPSTITRLLPGEDGTAPKRLPGWQLLREIAKATQGAVTANDFLDEPASEDAA